MNAPTPTPQAAPSPPPPKALPSTTEHEAPEPIKMILMAPSGYGKTGSLASLLSAGYNVRVIDLDAGIKSLRNLLRDDAKELAPKYAKDSLSRLAYATITDPMKAVGGKIIPTKAIVWPKTIGLFEHWKWDDPGTGTVCDLGPVTSWGLRDVVVIDTLKMLARGAFNFNLAMNGRLGSASEGNQYLRDIGSAQRIVDSLFALLLDTNIKCNVIINTHVAYSKEDGSMPSQEERDSATLFGFPRAIGKSLGPDIPTYFRDVLGMRKVGTGAQILTKGEYTLGLKSCAPLRVKPTYPRETGLAEYFAAIQGDRPWERLGA